MRRWAPRKAVLPELEIMRVAEGRARTHLAN